MGLQVYVSRQQSATTSPPSVPPPPIKPAADLAQRYRSFLREANLRVVDSGIRRTVVADFLATVQSGDRSLSLNAVSDLLKDRYDAENALTQKIAVPEVMRLLVMSGALCFAGGQRVE